MNLILFYLFINNFSFNVINYLEYLSIFFKLYNYKRPNINKVITIEKLIKFLLTTFY